MRIPRIPASGSAVAALTFLICALAGTATAQWLSIPLPGTPRTPDGKPNLKAATPRTADGKPDLSGIWGADSPRWNENLAPVGTEAPMLPAAAELYKHGVQGQNNKFFTPINGFNHLQTLKSFSSRIENRRLIR